MSIYEYYLILFKIGVEPILITHEVIVLTIKLLKLIRYIWYMIIIILIIFLIPYYTTPPPLGGYI